jgi:hypothetical protein
MISFSFPDLIQGKSAQGDKHSSIHGLLSSHYHFLNLRSTFFLLPLQESGVQRSLPFYHGYSWKSHYQSDFKLGPIVEYYTTWTISEGVCK